jgi:uncharacterized membrane protein
MAEFPVSDTTRSTAAPASLPTGAALAVYVLFGVAGVSELVSAGLAIAPLFGLIGFIGLVLVYLKRDEARGTWLESHFRWQTRTFWFALLWTLIGWVAMATLIFFWLALAIWAVTSLWIVYRVIRGVLRLLRREPMPAKK